MLTHSLFIYFYFHLKNLLLELVSCYMYLLTNMQKSSFIFTYINLVILYLINYEK